MVGVKTKIKKRKTKTDKLVELLDERSCTLEEILRHTGIWNANSFHSIRRALTKRKEGCIKILYNYANRKYYILREGE